MSAYAGNDSSPESTPKAAPTPAPKVAPTSAAPNLASTRRDHNEAWTHGWSSAQYQRAIVSVAEVVYTAGVGAFSIFGAYLILYSWPPSLGSLDPWYRDALGTLRSVAQSFLAPELRPYLPLIILSPATHIFLFRRLRLISAESGRVTPFGGMRRLLQGSLVGAMVVAVCGGILRIGPAEFGMVHVTVFYFLAGFLIFTGILLCHSALCIGLLTLRTLGFGRTRVAIAGTPAATIELRQALEAEPTQFRYAGLIALAPPSPEQSPEPIGQLARLEDLVNQHQLEELILAFDPGEITDNDRRRIAQTCWRLGVDLKMVSPFHPYFQTPGATEFLGDIPLVRVQRIGLYATRSQIGKRAMDVIVSATLLLLLSPFLLLTALAIKLDSRGPILFSQARPGLYGRVFQILKFRSMIQDADTTLHREAQAKLIQGGEAAEHTPDGRPIFGKVRSDPRVTRIGRFIRPTSIDELPQLVNVLRGEMSLVGPRPSVLYELENYAEHHRARLNCRPGITGLWQVSGRSRLSFEQMIQLDLRYIERWSIWFDLLILLRTIPVLLKLDQAR